MHTSHMIVGAGLSRWQPQVPAYFSWPLSLPGLLKLVNWLLELVRKYLLGGQGSLDRQFKFSAHVHMHVACYS